MRCRFKGEGEREPGIKHRRKTAALRARKSSRRKKKRTSEVEGMKEKKKLENDQNRKGQVSSWQWCVVVEEVQVEGWPGTQMWLIQDQGERPNRVMTAEGRTADRDQRMYGKTNMHQYRLDCCLYPTS